MDYTDIIFNIVLVDVIQNLGEFILVLEKISNDIYGISRIVIEWQLMSD